MREELEQASSRADDLSGQLDSAQGRISELEGNVVLVEQRLGRQVGEAERNQMIVDKTKKALAVALTLLEEQYQGKSDNG